MDADPRTEPASAGCLAADVVRAGIDPLTGRTLSYHHVPMAAWAGHLADLLLLGRLTDVDGVATAGADPGPADLHPLVAAAWARVEPRLPRPWHWMSAPQVVDVNDAAAEARRWLVDTGMWSRHRTLFGSRYRSTGAAPSPIPPPAPGPARTRRALLPVLVGIALPGTESAAAASPRAIAELDRALRRVVMTTTELIVAKVRHPAFPATIGR